MCYSWSWQERALVRGKRIPTFILTRSRSSSIIDSLASNPDGSVAYFYCSFRDTRKQCLMGILSSLVSQLATRSEPCLAILRDLRSKHPSPLSPNEHLLGDCLTAMLRKLPCITLVIDALDECPERSRGGDILPFLRKLATLNISGLRVLVASRSEYNIRVYMDTHSTHSLDLGHVAERGDDLVRYIDRELSDRRYGKWLANDELRSMARDVLIEKAGGM
jgi:hypothetical protein